ncbi:MAG: hypothetical protein AAB906_02810, partial [Patescibacteria group bacterium]
MWQTKNKENIIKIKTYSKAVFPILLIAMGVISLGAIRNNSNVVNKAFDASGLSDSIDSEFGYESLSSIESLEGSGLPIAAIKKHEVENAIGT